MADLPDSVRRNEIFRGLSDAELGDVISLASLVDVPAGEQVVRRGEAGDGLYVIASGQVRITRQDGPLPDDLAVLGEGEVFGEMALLTEQPRVADAIAATDCRLYCFERLAFAELLDGQDRAAHALLRGFAVMLCERLSSAQR